MSVRERERDQRDNRRKTEIESVTERTEKASERKRGRKTEKKSETVRDKEKE